MADDVDFANHPPATAPDMAIGASSNQASGYHIVHRKTGQVVGKAKTRISARRVLDRHDNNYGSYAHKIVEVGSDKERL